MSDLEADRGIVWRNQDQPPVHQRLPMFPEHRRLFEAVGQDARHAPARIQRPAHRSPIDAPGAARYQAALRRCGESPHVLGVLNQRLVHVPGADDRQAAGAQDRGLATAVEYRGSVLSKALLSGGAGNRHPPGSGPRSPASASVPPPGRGETRGRAAVRVVRNPARPGTRPRSRASRDPADRRVGAATHGAGGQAGGTRRRRAV